MPLYDLAGSTTGAGDVAPVTPVRALVTGGSILGEAVASTDVQRTLIFGGQTYGFGGIEDHLTIYVGGSTTGQGATSGYLVRISPLQGSTIGACRLYESCPEPLIGRGFLTGFIVVDRVPCPISCATLPAVKSFRWGHTFVRGDLMLSLRDGGNPYAPIIVLYRMFRVLPGGALYPVGPFNRRPAVCGKSLGVYYATGTAGELGQPGDWVIEWRWQRSTFSPTQTVSYPFKVLDAVLDTSIPDATCRVKKYGWDE